MKGIQAFYVALIGIIHLLGLGLLRMSSGENLETTRATYQHHIAPNEATRRRLAEVKAANDHALILPGSILGVSFVGSIYVLLRTTRQLRTPLM